MNQHFKRGGQANGNSMDKVGRGATRPTTVVAIVLCVGFSVATVAIWSCGKPPSHQETQTQPEAAVQTEIPTPEAVSSFSVPDQDVPPETSTATPVSQASPAASQLVDDHVNSPVNSPANAPTPAQDDQNYDFSHELNQETITFEAVNPGTKVAGLMTVTITGAFRGKRLSDGESPAGSHLKGDEEATFSFFPHDPYSPSYSATVKHMQVAGDTTNDSVLFDFGLETAGSDGSSQEFSLREEVTVTEDGAHITFKQLNKE